MSDLANQISPVTARSREEWDAVLRLIDRRADNDQDRDMLRAMFGLVPPGNPQCSECGKAQQHLRVTELTPLGACGRCHNRLRSKAATAARWEA